MKATLPLGALVLALAAGGAQAQEGFKVIAHPGNPGSQIKRETLAAIFMSGLTRWGDGTAVKPVDQSTRSPVRQAFSESVLKQSVLAVQNHWLQQIGAGRGTPPVVKGSDLEVLTYVKSTPGAVGYVAADFAADGGVKLLKVVE